MLEKDKNCIEFSMRSMMVTHRPYQEDMEIAITGMAPEKSLLLANNPFNNPFNIPCDVVVVSKSYFERMQADDQHYRELAKQREHNYELLLTMTGFNTLEELTDYIHDAGKNSKGCWKTLKEIADDAEKDYIFERDKAEVFQTKNEQLKKKLEEFSPVPGYREFLMALYPGEDVEKLVWATEQLCCGRDLQHALQVDLEYYRTLSSSQAKFNKAIFELIGFSSIEEIHDYLTNEAEADTLHEAILKLKDQVKYTCDEWYSANSSNNSWKAAAECNSPKELMEKIKGFETEIIDLKTKNTEYACRIQNLIDDSCGRKTVIEAYKRDIERWKEATGCPSPIMAKTLIESGMSYEHGYHEVQEENRKLTDDINSWKNVTGYSIPEDFLSAMINNKPQSLYSWQKATGCKTPEEAKEAREKLNDELDTSLTENEELKKEVSDYKEQIKSLYKVIESWNKVTCCSTPEEAKNWVNELGEPNGSLAKAVLSWQEITGFSTPKNCSSYIDTLEKKLEDIKDLIEED